jgi:phosphatidylglycerol:prolipoprotein diacylglycerol transferase
MRPILFSAGGFELRSYTFMAVVAMLAALAAVRLETRRLGWDVAAATRWTAYATVVGFIGSHTLYALTRWDLQGAEWWRMLLDVGHGHVWFGGFLLSWALCQWLARRNHIPSLQMWDVAAFAVLMANPVGRIGCFLNGCCYGIPTTLPWGVSIYSPEIGAVGNLHPVPLYEFFYQVGVFALLWSLRRRNRHDGQTAARYLILMPTGRFLLEFLRGDTIRGFVWGWLSTSQALALGLIAAGVALYAIQRRKHADFTLLPGPPVSARKV